MLGCGDTQLSLEVKVLRRVAKNCVGYSAGYKETLALQPATLVTLTKDAKWQRREPQLIASDRTIPDPIILDPNIAKGGSAHV